MRLDALDRHILALLQQDARASLRHIAKQTGSTTPTVAARVRAMEDIGLLQGYHARIDAAVLGGRSILLIVGTRPSAAARAASALAGLEGVEAVHVLAGGRIAAHVRLRGAMAALHEAVAGIEGVESCDIHEVIATHAGRAALVEGDVDVPCHQCGGPIHAEPVRARLGDRAHVFCCRQCADAFRARFEKAAAKA